MVAEDWYDHLIVNATHMDNYKPIPFIDIRLKLLSA